jgi:3-oxoacyl-(acyl-carrier-protein) synthase
MSQRTTVVVTGMGIASAVGWTPDEVWAAMKEGRSGLKTLSLFESPRCGKLLVGQIDQDRRSGAG